MSISCTSTSQCPAHGVCLSVCLSVRDLSSSSPTTWLRYSGAESSAAGGLLSCTFCSYTMKHVLRSRECKTLVKQQ